MPRKKLNHPESDADQPVVERTNLAPDEFYVGHFCKLQKQTTANSLSGGDNCEHAMVSDWRLFRISRQMEGLRCVREHVGTGVELDA